MRDAIVGGGSKTVVEGDQDGSHDAAALNVERVHTLAPGKLFESSISLLQLLNSHYTNRSCLRCE